MENEKMENEKMEKWKMENEKPFVGTDCRITAEYLEKQLRNIDFQIVCLQSRRYELQQAAKYLSFPLRLCQKPSMQSAVLGLTIEDYCELRAAIAIGYAITNVGYSIKNGR
jgi:hypothetical protein